MKFCDDHWTRLRAAIAERGLDDLVATDGERAAHNLKSELEDGSSIANFDPLMGAHNAILSNAMALVGLVLMTNNQQCPLCVLNAEHERTCVDPTCQVGTSGFDEWIDRAADDMKAKADELRSAG